MNYLDKLNEKKAQIKAKADADAILGHIDSVAKAVKNTPDSELASKVTVYIDELKQIVSDYQNLAKSHSDTAKEHDDHIKMMFNDVHETLKGIKMPDMPQIPEIKLPEIIIPEIKAPKVSVPKMDMQCVADAISELKQDDDIDLDDYHAHDIKDDGDIQYIGFLDPDGNWYIMESKQNTLRYVFGHGGYTQAFNKAATYKYELLNEAINDKV